MPGSADGAAAGQAAGEAGSLEGHAVPVTVAAPLASKIVAAVVVVTKERVATTTPVRTTPSTARIRSRLLTRRCRLDLRAGIAPLHRRPGAAARAHHRSDVLAWAEVPGNREAPLS